MKLEKQELRCRGDESTAAPEATPNQPKPTGGCDPPAWPATVREAAQKQTINKSNLIKARPYNKLTPVEELGL